MVHFKNKTVKLYNEEENAQLFGVDGYNDPNSGMVLKATIKGNFQPLSVNETLKTYGEMVQGVYVVYLDPADLNFTVTSDFKVKIEGYENYFQINGNPEYRETLIPHIKLNLQYEGVSQL